MSEFKQPPLRDPEFLRVVAENLEFQRTAALMQWETLLLFPMPLIVEPQMTLRVQEIIQTNNPYHTSQRP
jgi:hypothetical protein